MTPPDDKLANPPDAESDVIELKQPDPPQSNADLHGEVAQLQRGNLGLQPTNVVAATKPEVENTVKQHLLSYAQALFTKLHVLEESSEILQAKASLQDVIHSISAHFHAQGT